ncbi:MAG: hypothetical protein GWM88_18120 [Pseudomonadales bacterium]|nr:hypothetical protein [Pseudomonadales bacterium]NIX09843.1 hypothetical protein [Pseudomonadales bacterium]
MAGAILTLILAFVAGGALWVGVGPRLKLVEDAERNQLLNLLAYIAIALPVAFAVVFYLLELI